MDYFTKYIKVEALANITVANTVKFFKKNVLASFIVSQAIVIDNGTQFINRKLVSLLEELKIK